MFRIVICEEVLMEMPAVSSGDIDKYWRGMTEETKKELDSRLVEWKAVYGE